MIVKFKTLGRNYIYDSEKNRFDLERTGNDLLDSVGLLYSSIMNEYTEYINSYLPLLASLSEYFKTVFPRWPIEFSEETLSDPIWLNAKSDDKIY
jgi:hypothetical protein